MNGNRYLLDTNAVIALLQGHAKLLKCLNNAEWIGISVLSQLEFLSFRSLTQEDKECFAQFMKRVDIIGLDTYQKELIDAIIRLRQEYCLKLPDAVIAGTALCFESILVTSDRQLHKIGELSFFNF